MSTRGWNFCQSTHTHTGTQRDEHSRDMAATPRTGSNGKRSKKGHGGSDLSAEDKALLRTIIPGLVTTDAKLAVDDIITPWLTEYGSQLQLRPPFSLFYRQHRPWVTVRAVTGGSDGGCTCPACVKCCQFILVHGDWR